MKNREAAIKFFDSYFKTLGFPIKPDDTKVLSVHYGDRGEMYLVQTQKTLSEYFALQAVQITDSEYLVDFVLAVIDGPLATAINVASRELIKSIKDTERDFTAFEEYHINVAKGLLAEQIKNGVILPDAQLSTLRSSALSMILEGILKSITGTFDDKKVFEFITKQISDYYESLNRAINSGRGGSLEVSEENMIKDALAYAALVKEKEDFINKNVNDVTKKRVFMDEYYVFVDSYVTSADFYNAVMDSIIHKAFKETKNECEYYFDRSKAEDIFCSLYSVNPRDKEKNGEENGIMESFSQTYAYARLVLNIGVGDPFLSEMVGEVKPTEWENTNSAESKMSVWNSEVGRIIAANVIANFTSPSSPFNVPKEHKAEAQRLITEYTKAAIEMGIIVKSINDPRLQFMDDSYGVEFPLDLLQKNAVSMLGVLDGKGTNIMRILKSYLSSSKAPGLEMMDMMESIMKNWNYEVNGVNFTDIHDNDEPSSTDRHYGFGTKDAAHRYLQIVDWANSSKLGIPNYDVCNPQGDPIVDSETGYPLRDKLDEDDNLKGTEGKMFYVTARSWEGYEADDPKTKPSRLPTVTAVSYANDGTYSVVFKDLQGEDEVIFREIVRRQDIKAFADYYLNPAFLIYKHLIEDGAHPMRITFLGYDEGGAIAAALSAAMYSGAFTQDGRFDSALAAYGWSLDANGEVIDNYPAISIETYTYASAPMGWLFQKPLLIEKDPTQDSKDINGYKHTYEFLYPKDFPKDFPEDYRKPAVEYLDKITEAPVVNYGMGLDKIFASGRVDFPAIGGNQIGNVLHPNDGILSLVTENMPHEHSLDHLELALHPKPEEEKKGGGEEDSSQYKGGHDHGAKSVPDQKSADVKLSLSDPLIIDLNRDGKVSTTRQSRYFDLDANGFAERASWAATGDGLLVLDRDGDGVITSGRELFGDHTVMSNGKVAISGFQALADLDSNGDGVIDAKDELFSKLRVWADLDADGVFGDDELISLEELGIESIDLSYDENRSTDENGNLIVRTGKVTWKDGDTSPMNEFLLDRNTTKIDYKAENISEEIQKMPDLNGTGYLMSLHAAMEKDKSRQLMRLVEGFVNEKDPTVRRDQLESIMQKWVEVSDVVGNSLQNPALRFLEKFYGGGFTLGRGEIFTVEGYRQVMHNYEAVSTYLYGKLLEQTHYADIESGLRYYRDEEGKLCLNISDAVKKIAEGYAQNDEIAKQALGEFFWSLGDGGDYTSVCLNNQGLISAA